MKLTTLRPRLATLSTTRLKPVEHAAGARPAGRGWQETRARIQVRDYSLCADCGKLWRANRDHVDHEVPRWKGGSDEDGNLRLRCLECHKAKTDREAAERAALGG